MLLVLWQVLTSLCSVRPRARVRRVGSQPRWHCSDGACHACTHGCRSTPPRSRSPAHTHTTQAKSNQLVDAPSIFAVNKSRSNVAKQSAIYSELHAEGASTQARVGRAQEMVNQYYDLATDFYE